MANPLVTILGKGQQEGLVELALRTPAVAFVEVGVFHGGSAYLLYEIAQKQNRELHLFDTFTGTPFYIDGLDSHRINAEFADAAAPLRIREVMPEAHLHVGVYPKTHPEDLKDIAFVHCDCDQYESYIAVIERMWPLMVSRGILLFDDYPYLEGAKQAVEERFTKDRLKRQGRRYYVVKEFAGG